MTAKTFPMPQPAPYDASPFGASSAKGLLSFGAGLVGGILQNRAQKRAAQRQMDFQERMSNTAYQRAAKDLEAAGLNRVLALGSPSSSPGGSKAEVVNPVTSAIALRRNKAEIENIEANTAKTNAETPNVYNQGNIISAQWDKVQTEITNLRKSGTLLNVQIDVQNALKKIRNSESIIIKSEADLWDTLQELDAGEAGAMTKLLGPSAMTLMKLAIHAMKGR